MTKITTMTFMEKKLSKMALELSLGKVRNLMVKMSMVMRISMERKMMIRPLQP